MASISPERRALLEKEGVKNSTGGSFYNTKNLTDDKIRLLPLGPSDYIGYKRVTYYLNDRSHVCNEGTNGQPGVIAKALRAMDELGTPKALECAESIRSQYRTKWVMKIISRRDPTVPKWFEAPKAIYTVAYDAMMKDGDDIAHPKEGRDIRISKGGSGMKTEYTARVLPDAIPLAPTREERDAIRAKAAEMDIGTLLRADEKAAIEALEAIVPESVWEQIRGQVVGEAASGSGKAKRAAAEDLDDEDAPSKPAKGRSADAEDLDDEDAPVAKASPKASAKPAADLDDEDAPPAKATKAKPAPVDDDEDTPPAKAKAAAAADDDDEVAPPAKKAAAGKAVTIDDDEDEAPRSTAKKTHQVDDEE
jgi:hypothetical protein